MLTTPMDVLTRFPVRKTKAQKQAFRDAVQDYSRQFGYPSVVESGKRGCRNLVIGDPEQAKYLITAHYDTCAKMPIANRLYADNPFLYFVWQFLIAISTSLIPLLCAFLGSLAVCIAATLREPGLNTNLMTGLAAIMFLGLFLILFTLSYCMVYAGPANPSNANDNTSGVVTLLEILQSLPENQRNKVCFVLFDQNETGLHGSAAYYKRHKDAVKQQLVLNLSCVGDGDHIFLFPTANLKMNTPVLSSVYKCCGYFGAKSILVMEKNGAIHPSDHKRFPTAVNISAFHKGKTGHFIDRIHTPRDTKLDITNVNLLRAAIISMISAAQ